MRKAAVEAGLKSGFELQIRDDLTAAGVPFEYEAIALSYKIGHTYTPDFRLRTKSGRTIFVEAKGYFDSEDRTKIRAVLDQNPLVDLRIVFQRARTPIRKGSPTTYAMWADRAGIKWAEKYVPKAWLDE